eukprot:1378819-Amphidinium_carterae.1
MCKQSPLAKVVKSGQGSNVTSIADNGDSSMPNDAKEVTLVTLVEDRFAVLVVSGVRGPSKCLKLLLSKRLEKKDIPQD